MYNADFHNNCSYFLPNRSSSRNLCSTCTQPAHILCAVWSPMSWKLEVILTYKHFEYLLPFEYLLTIKMIFVLFSHLVLHHYRLWPEVQTELLFHTYISFIIIHVSYYNSVVIKWCQIWFYLEATARNYCYWMCTILSSIIHNDSTGFKHFIAGCSSDITNCWIFLKH